MSLWNTSKSVTRWTVSLTYPVSVKQSRSRLVALDETAFAQKTGHGTWLHEEIAQVAVRVIGVDLSNIVPDDGLVTAHNAVITGKTS
jgi:hypothetical protein